MATVRVLSEYTRRLIESGGQEIWEEGTIYWELPAVRIGRTVLFPGGFSRQLGWREYFRIKTGRQMTVSRNGG